MSIKQFRLSGHARKQLIRLKTRTALALELVISLRRRQGHVPRAACC